MHKSHDILKSFICVFLALAAVLFPAAAYAAAPEPEDICVPSAILIDSDSGDVLYEKNADAPMPPASTTKVMTALLVVEAADRGELSYTDTITATQEMNDSVIYDASRVLPYIETNEIMTVEDLLYCVLLESDCVACNMLAQKVSGSVDAFVELMNRRAAELGCTGTTFLNTHGYPAEGHVATARSLALIMREAMKHDVFVRISGTIKLMMPPTNVCPSVRQLYNSNWLLWDPAQIHSIYCAHYYKYAVCGKTGTSDDSGHCLVSGARKGEAELICVILGGGLNPDAQGVTANQQFSQSAKLYEWGFANFTKKKLIMQGDAVTAVKVTGGTSDTVLACAAETVNKLLPGDINTELLEKEITIYDGSVAAPVSAGDVIGEMKFTSEGKQYASVALLASADVTEKTVMETLTEKSESKNKIANIIIISVAAAACLCAAVFFFAEKSHKKLVEEVKAAEAAEALEKKKHPHKLIVSNGAPLTEREQRRADLRKDHFFDFDNQDSDSDEEAVDIFAYRK